MNDNSHAHSHGHGHEHHHGGHEASHGSMKTYMIGFILSVILTSIPFYLVMSGSLTNKALLAGIVMGLGAIQVVVHMIYFLHMNTKSEGGWNMMALIFTIIVVVIALSGSLWVMHHLNTNMMPMSPEMMRNVP
ncbi:MULTISPECIES: cytochrome o ubiquinol oxidase subunit IV [Rhizobium/Agrobacterium group]|uniref:cytochrome o ubiquinol oxidase subunit IV n=1 Tax=Rhizobium/Agrobacterium group TaxID=227290 RepID=UPI000B402D5A|nr:MULTISPECIES: cytochrome o ubiquinol oxidase subunit IV [Rhizobium/Agrobacterium group]MCF1463692.1 cytochrome o ubiquinol oxidase subunit IV [Allorhizobium ampelinum]MCF1472538.1 cytochrome o ubiquinol oxidase subunit IV [Allorhizobium ampelinum]MVA49738.1 cytochrome o ubiquinol oxidase subunit IV [Agrobacterium vitis]MVA69896.1 cytochrome o ubiquinol oxidase subunit IV [Agrobacterium vitis]NSZ19336.1 cytochrome o ubiquinol oxidase subunit IV [Agrobacterium vitis]